MKNVRLHSIPGSGTIFTRTLLQSHGVEILRRSHVRQLEFNEVTGNVVMPVRKPESVWYTACKRRNATGSHIDQQLSADRDWETGCG